MNASTSKDSHTPAPFSRSLWLTVGMFVLLTLAFTIYAWSEKQIDRANELRLQSFLLADELRQSSDDLTRTARAYVATGNPLYKQQHQDILDIRDGKKPRPDDYQKIYWDLITAGDKPPRPSSGLSIPLLELMRQAGFTDQEFRKLAEAKANSDALTATEQAAMKLAESVGPDAEANKAKASRMLYGDSFHKSKAAIMKPINEFYSMMDRRTEDAVHRRATNATILRILFIVLGLGLAFTLWRTFKGLNRSLGASVDEVHAHIARIGSGDFSADIAVPVDASDSVMGWLSEMQKSLLELHASKQKITQQLFQQQAHLHLLLDTIPDLIWLKDENGVYLACNPMFERFFGASESEIIGKTDYDFIDKDLADFFREHDRKAMAANQPSINEEEVVFADDGHHAHLETIKTPMFDAEGKLIGILGISRDITPRKIAESKIQRMTELYATLSQCNQAIVRCNSQEELFPQICRDAVEFGKLKMAWIGLTQPLTRMIKPVASFGAGIEYLDGIEIVWDGENPLGLGPTGIACREDHPVWCQDFQSDPRTAPWHERAAKYQWGSSASLPLHCDGKVVGVFTLYAGAPNAFDKDARQLLIEMSVDISFALTRFSSERRRQEAEAQLNLAAEVFRHSTEGFVITDALRNIILVNEAFTHITGYSREDVLGQNPNILASHRQDEQFYQAMWEAIDTQGFWRGEVWNRRKDGSIYPEWLSITRVNDANGNLTHYIGIFNDITLHKQSEERIQWLAHFDELTGLPNRTLLTDRVNHAISVAQRKQGTMALIFLDIDHFKNVNDSLGHHVGDKLLMQLAQRLKETVRNEDTVARMGGDEFILMLADTDVHGATHVAEKILSSIAQPYQIDQYELITTPSIGIAMYPNDGQDMDALFKCADTAMYRAKQGGRNNYCFFTSEMQLRSARTLLLENALRHAVDDHQLVLHFQPQISLENGQVIGAEALVRWQHPEFGLVSPAEFIPIAEDTGQILKIGEWVLRSAVRQLKSWMDKGMAPITIAVNLSAVQFRQRNLAEWVMQVLDEVGLPAQNLELELTESAAMGDPLSAIETMDSLHARGISMSIDDFGTGYSSLSYLKRFQVYKLKIDQSFVRDITIDAEDKAIVAAIVSLAKSLGLKTIAEGVETESQLAFLRDQGCDEVQGYHFSKPLPADQFERFVQGINQAG